MDKVGNYYVKNSSNLISDKESIIMGEKYRITILTDRLVRLEYSKNGIFEDRATQNVIFRKFKKPNFTVSQSEMLIQITTSQFVINYDKNKSFDSGKLVPGSNLKITLLNSEHFWYYKKKDKKNFGTVDYSLDNFKKKLKFSNGMYSGNGFTCLDDSNSLVVDDFGNLVPRENKELDLYVFIYKKDLGGCLRDYFTLTGYPQLVPRYSLGNWWFKDDIYDNNSISSLVSNFKKYDIPMSMFLFGNSWHREGDSIFFDESRINISSIGSYLKDNNVHMGVVVKPDEDIKPNTNSYNYLSRSGLITTDNVNLMPVSDSQINIINNVLVRNLISCNVDSVLINYNNIKDKNNLGLLVHNIHASYELFSNRRALVLSRNHGIVPHRNTVLINGKTRVDWETLEVLPEYMASASNGGLSYLVTPIGGYYGGIENFELYIRYIEFGVFSPFLVLASEGGKYYKREPWRWNEAQMEIISKYLNLRNKLIPYIYTEAYNYHKYGSPIVQPMYYKYPKLYGDNAYKNQYLFGSSILVCPITKNKNELIDRTVMRVFIPDGVWYNFLNGKKYIGNKYYDEFYQEDDYPVFCKAGSIIPMSLDMNTNNPVNMEIDIFPGNNGEYNLYEDDSVTNSYLSGNYCITNFKYEYSSSEYKLTIKADGALGLVPGNRNYKIVFKNTNQEEVKVIINGTEREFDMYTAMDDLVVNVKNVSNSDEIVVICNGNNLENSNIQTINDDIKNIIISMKIDTESKEKLDKILFSDLSIKDKKKKIKKVKIEAKFINLFIGLLNYIKTV